MYLKHARLMNPVTTAFTMTIYFATASDATLILA